CFINRNRITCYLLEARGGRTINPLPHIISDERWASQLVPISSTIHRLKKFGIDHHGYPSQHHNILTASMVCPAGAITSRSPFPVGMSSTDPDFSSAFLPPR